MALTFKEYVVISDAISANQLEEGWMENAIIAIKKKLGGKISDDEIKAEIAAMKTKVSDTKQSKDFHERRKAQEKQRLQREIRGILNSTPGARGTQPTVGTSQADIRKAQNAEGRRQQALARNAERDWHQQFESLKDESLTEATKEYRVEYTAKAGGTTRIGKIKAQDVTAVREKFKRDFHGMKILTITPAKPAPKKRETVEEHGPLGPRQILDEAKAEMKTVVMKVSFDYITNRDDEAQGSVTLFHTCKTAEEASALIEKITAAQDEGLIDDSGDYIYHWGQNSYNNFSQPHGDAIYIETMKLASKEPALGRKVYAFNPADFKELE